MHHISKSIYLCQKKTYIIFVFSIPKYISKNRPTTDSTPVGMAVSRICARTIKAKFICVLLNKSRSNLDIKPKCRLDLNLKVIELNRLDLDLDDLEE